MVKKGIKFAKQEVPDLIISDIMMPEKDGFQVSEILKLDVRTSHIPIILLTARGDRESRITGWKSQVDEYITKPFDDEELLVRISNLLSIRALLRKRFSQSILQNDIDGLEKIRTEFGIIDRGFLDKFDQVIQSGFTMSQFGVKQIANQMSLSERQLQRKIKSLIDISPSEYLRNYRLNYSHQSLLRGKAIKAVAFDCGFSSVGYFSNCFKARFGVTPKQTQD